MAVLGDLALFSTNLKGDPGETTKAPLALGSITYNATTRALSIEGNDTQNDTVNVYVNHRGSNLPDLLGTRSRLDQLDSTMFDPVFSEFFLDSHPAKWITSVAPWKRPDRVPMIGQ